MRVQCVSRFDRLLIDELSLSFASPTKAWFYNPQEDTSGFVNKLVSRLDPPFCHCELQFGDNHACSIYMGSNVVFKERAFQSSNYTAVDLECASVRICACSRAVARVRC